jgi:outer membrane lipoprotein-sorting protein
LNVMRAICLLLLILVAAGEVRAQDEAPPIGELLARLSEVYGRQCCFRSSFDQVTVNVAMDMKDHFEGMMYVKRPGMIALEVEEPEKQQVTIRGRSYAIYFPSDGSAVRGEVPPEMNVEHFFSFLANVDDMAKNFHVAYAARAVDPAENLLVLELTDRKNPGGTYRIVVGVDRQRFLVRRAIIYDALGNYNRFDLSDIVFLSSLPDSRFRVAPSRAEDGEPFAPVVPQDRDK